MVIDDTDPRFPLQLCHRDGPHRLYVRGHAPLLLRPLVAIVGSRDVSPEAELFTERLVGAVGRLGFGVVSGGARGIDAAAHRGCRVTQTPTVVVLGTPLEGGSPSKVTREVLDHLDWDRDVAISEQPPAGFTLPHHFVERNRIIARLAHAVVVVRARVASGALSTASFAIAAQRPLYAVPGAPWDERAIGVNSLLTQGARPLRCIKDLTDGLREQFGILSEPAVPTPLADPRLDFLTTPRSVEELMLAWRLNAEQVLRTLVQYEIGGCVRRLIDGRFVCQLS